jgi:hypothetical protein
VADATVPSGVLKRTVTDLIKDSMYVAVLRSHYRFETERRTKLDEFVNDVIHQNKFYDFVTAANFNRKSTEYFEKQLQFVRDNYAKIDFGEEFEKRSYICSAFVVACYLVVGIIDKTAYSAYVPEFFSPGHLSRDPTFGWLLGYLVVEGETVPADEPLLSQATLWKDHQDVRWW